MGEPGFHDEGDCSHFLMFVLMMDSVTHGV